ncbi:MAG TPA: hypothetical protein H9874_06605 [Candidatus Bilophila faecipullorum]|uniref:Uncharacterized protein n=2 Tax=Bilophila TaxID=35832 RepID=A0A9D1QZJ8_9BACT|nr:hypothetical protein [Candidatus Bilophila faecipullorum]
MKTAPFDVMVKTSDEAEKFLSGEYGRAQAFKVAKTITTDVDAIKAIAMLFIMLHDEGRKKTAASHALFVRRG